MRTPLFAMLGAVTTAGFLVAIGAPVSASPDVGPGASPGQVAADSLPNPMGDKQSQLRQAAIADVLSGRRDAVTRNGSTVVKVGEKAAAPSRAAKAKARAGRAVKAQKVDQYVELKRQSTDRIFVVLAEFGDQRDANYPDQDTDPNTAGPTVFDGPLHNAIPEPDRTKDNSTVWQSDYSPDYFRQLYFGKKGESLKTYYQKQSSGRYSVDGEVTDWVKVPYNEARYGRSNGYPCAGNVCSNTWALVRDAVNKWVADQEAAGRTKAEITADLKSFDQWDRYDYDGDGDFNEPDGYIDHFQIVHAGGDQADGDPYQGEDAVWSHRWYAYYNQAGQAGPADNELGGTQVGDTGLWVGDYTIQPENGGLSVFAHEYGHDLGLPDLYDTTGVGQGGPEFWSLMSQSRLSAKNDEGIGTRPGDLGAWEKLQLGWLDYEIAVSGQKRTYELGPHEYNSAKAQALAVVLPKKQVTSDLVPPASGAKSWWSGGGNDLDNTLAASLTLPADPATLTFQARYNIEDCGPDPCDYAYVEVNDGAGWAAIPGSITHPDEGNGIDGLSDGWKPATFDLSAYAGKTVGLRFRYLTDGAAAGADPTKVSGLFVDDVKVTAGGATLLDDGAEAGAGPWTTRGFTAVGATTTTSYDNFYLASNRTYTSYDRYLQTGPYNFGWATTRPDWVEHFPLQNGLLVSYWDTSYADNDSGNHPGSGLILPVDAHPRPIYRLDGQPWRVRVANYDSTFGLEKADSFTLHVNGQANYIRGQTAQPLFDDTRSYWDAATPYASVKVANAGVTLKVLRQEGTSMRVRLGSK